MALICQKCNQAGGIYHDGVDFMCRYCGGVQYNRVEETPQEELDAIEGEEPQVSNQFSDPPSRPPSFKAQDPQSGAFVLGETEMAIVESVWRYGEAEYRRGMADGEKNAMERAKQELIAKLMGM